MLFSALYPLERHRPTRLSLERRFFNNAFGANTHATARFTQVDSTFLLLAVWLSPEAALHVSLQRSDNAVWYNSNYR